MEIEVLKIEVMGPENGDKSAVNGGRGVKDGGKGAVNGGGILNG